MKTLIVAPLPVERVFDPVVEFPEDVARLVAAAGAAGFQVAPEDAAELWCRQSSSVCASWLSLQSCDDETLVRLLLEYGVVVDMPTNLPPPPMGYASWVDYAVVSMDTRTVEPERLRDEGGPGSRPSGQEMQDAARLELEVLRRRAGILK